MHEWINEWINVKCLGAECFVLCALRFVRVLAQTVNDNDDDDYNDAVSSTCRLASLGALCVPARLPAHSPGHQNGNSNSFQQHSRHELFGSSGFQLPCFYVAVAVTTVGHCISSVRWRARGGRWCWCWWCRWSYTFNCSDWLLLGVLLSAWLNWQALNALCVRAGSSLAFLPVRLISAVVNALLKGTTKCI